jgi:hypothetical protein
MGDWREERSRRVTKGTIVVLGSFLVLSLIGNVIRPSKENAPLPSVATSQSPPEANVFAPSNPTVLPRAIPASEDGVHYADGPDYVPPASHPGMTRDEQIKALQKADPSSHGYTDADREFLAEQGIDPAEARAIEEAMARSGYKD